MELQTPFLRRKALFSAPVALLASLCWVLFVGAASAESESGVEKPPAGFDCDRANGVDEKIICSDSLLRLADHALAEHYQALLAATSDSAHIAALRLDEHGWIMQRNRECGVTKTTKVTEANGRDFVDCFLASYDERMADIERMQANPEANPITISDPIRRSLFLDPTDRESLSYDHVTETGLYAESADHPLIAWQADGSLIIVGKGMERTSATVYLWREGKPSVLLVPELRKTSKIERLCPHGDAVYVIRRGVTSASPPTLSVEKIGVASATMRPVSAEALGAQVLSSCGIDAAHRLSGDDTGSTSLDLGLFAPDQRTQQQGRFLTVRNGVTERVTDPPVRIDRRFPLAAHYFPFAKDYLVSVTEWPSDLLPTVERRWAKTNCLVFWRVSAITAKASRQCIPFGAYVGSAPQPLLTAQGLFFSSPDAGLYSLGETGANRVLPGPIEGATVSADGCQIAYAGAPLKEGGLSVRVLRVCRGDSPPPGALK